MESAHVEVTTIALVVVLAVLVIVLVHRLAPRVGVATPLVLVLLGVGISFVPAVPAITVEPEWILAGVLPPLLYATAVSLPSMDFRRDFTAIGGLSVFLVLISSLVLGAVFAAVIPGISLSIGIALGAILSPTDAVATSIVRRLGVSPRIVTVLEGESLLNDATSLVLMRSAIAATAVSVPLWQVGGTFVYSVVVAVVVGLVVGRGGLLLRGWLANPVLSTAVSFAVPFLAFIPTEALGGSGLVAVATAGLATGNGASTHLSPLDRRAEASNWRTVELLLEGGVFLVMGLELFGLVADVRTEHESLWMALGIATLAVVLILVLRALFVVPLLSWLNRRVRKGQELRDAYRDLRSHFAPTTSPAAGPVGTSPAGGTSGVPSAAPTGAPGSLPRTYEGDPTTRGGTSGPGASTPQATPPRGPSLLDLSALPEPVAWRMRRRMRLAVAHHPPSPKERIARWHRRLSRHSADIDYFTAEPLGPREGALLVWAGMRGVVTLAAAQSLPAGIPQRSLLVLVAFLVAAGTLLVQGSTLPGLARRLGLAGETELSDEDRIALRRQLDGAALAALDDPGLLRRDGSAYDAAVLQRARVDVDRMRISRAESAATTPDLFLQYRELRLLAIQAQRRALAAARASRAYSSRTLQYALRLLDSEQIEIQARRGPATPTDDEDD